MLLADYAQVADGKLNLIGGGWNVIGPGAPTFAVAVIIEVPWHRTNEKHRILLELVDADSHPVLVANAAGDEEPLAVSGDFEIGRPPGLKPGTSINFPLAVTVPPPRLEPDSRYEWRLTINGELHDEWRAAFVTAAA